MASIEPISLKVRDGSHVVLRPARAEDARAATDYLAELHEFDGEFLLTQADEFERDESRLAERYAKVLGDARSLHLLAWADTRIVGDVVFQGGSKRRIRHAGWLGIGVRRSWQGLGLGRLLMEALLDWAAAHDEIERVALKVYVQNSRALALYRSLGFVEESRSRRTFKLEDGSYADEFSMCLYVKPGAAPEGFRTYGSSKD